MKFHKLGLERVKCTQILYYVIELEILFPKNSCLKNQTHKQKMLDMKKGKEKKKD